MAQWWLPGRRRGEARAARLVSVIAVCPARDGQDAAEAAFRGSLLGVWRPRGAGAWALVAVVRVPGDFALRDAQRRLEAALPCADVWLVDRFPAAPPRRLAARLRGRAA